MEGGDQGLPGLLGSIQEHWRPQWGRVVLGRNGVNKSNNGSKCSTNGDAEGNVEAVR